MSHSEFHNLLTTSSNIAFEFAKNYVIDHLPVDFRYDVHLNVSLDDSSLKQFDIYPDDTGKIMNRIEAIEVVSLLNRNGKVPAWIDISVDNVYKNQTVFKLMCAGRYSDDEREFYYLGNGTGPFGVKSPDLPFDYSEGKKFKLRSKRKSGLLEWLKRL